MSLSVAVYGATGAVGSTLLVHLCNSNLLKAGDRVMLVGRGTEDNRTNLMAMRVDLLDAFDEAEVDLQVADDLEAVNADIFVMAAGKTASPEIRTRRGLAEENAPLFHDTARRLYAVCPAATVIVISNPVELGVAIFSRHFDRKRVMGMGAQQDSLRFARAIALRLGVRRSRVRASVFGEHGEAMVPAWSSVYIADPDPDLLSALIDLRLEFEGPEDASEARSAMSDVGSLLDDHQVGSAYALIETASPQAKAMVEPYITVTRLNSTPNATANATLAFIEALVRADERKLHGQVLLDGEFCDISGVCGAPIQLTTSGWHIASHEPLTWHERHQIDLAKQATDYVLDLAARASSGAGHAEDASPAFGQQDECGGWYPTSQHPGVPSAGMAPGRWLGRSARQHPSSERKRPTMSTNSKPDVSPGAEVVPTPNEMIDMIGGRLELVARMGAEESDAVLFRTSLAPGHGVPLHSHIDPECFYVLAGRLEVFLLGTAPQWQIVEAGRSVLVADGVKHAIRNPGDGAADLFVVTNNRFARFLREAGRPVMPGTAVAAPEPEDIERVARVARAYGYWLASPEKSAAVTGMNAPADAG